MNSGKMFDERLEPRRRTKTDHGMAPDELSPDKLMWWVITSLIVAGIVTIGLVAITVCMQRLI